MFPTKPPFAVLKQKAAKSRQAVIGQGLDVGPVWVNITQRGSILGFSKSVASSQSLNPRKANEGITFVRCLACRPVSLWRSRFLGLPRLGRLI